MASDVSLADSPIQDSLFGTLAVRSHFVLEDQVLEALLIQRELHQTGQPVPRLGEILTQRGYITEAQVQAVLKGQLVGAPKRFGEIAVAMHFCQPADIEAALTVQQQIEACGSHQRLGEILVARAALRPHQVHAVLRDQGKAIVACPNCNTRLNVSGVAPGATASCPRCKTVFRTPSVPVTTQATQAAADENVRVDMSAVMPPVGQAAPARSISRLTNAVIGHYQLGQRLGGDSSGVLYKASDQRTGTNVALRILDPSMTANPEDAERWLSAGEAAGELVHPNLQRILDINADADRIYLAMEYVEGESLRQSLGKRGKYPVLEAMDVLIQVAEALAYGHAHGFRHGDLRPAHVIVGFDGIVRVSGLGTPKNVSLNLRQVARQLGEEALPLYTPPEVMIDEENADERSDLYSLGGIAYQMLCGRPPHEGTNVLQVGLKVASNAARPLRELEPGIPPYVGRIVEKCLRPEPDDRYDSAAALIDDLRKARQAIFSSVPDVPEIAPPRPSAGLHRGQVLQAASPERDVRGTTGGPPVAPTGSLAQRLREKTAAAAARKSRLHTHVPRSGRGRHGAAASKPKFQGRPDTPVGPQAGLRVPPASPTVPAHAPSPAPKTAKGRGVAFAIGTTVPLPGDTTIATSDNLGLTTADAGEQPGAHEPEGRVGNSTHNISGKTREAAPLDTGVSTKAVLIGTGVTILLVVVLIVAMAKFGSKPPAAPVEADVPKAKTEPAAPAVSIAGNPEASRDWRLLQDYIKTKGDDHLGIVQRLETFKLKFAGAAGVAEQLQSATELLQKHCGLGRNATQPQLRAAMQKALDANKFGEADKIVNAWKEQWRGDSETAGSAKALLEEAAAKQKQMAESRLEEALRLRKEKKWDEADAIYKGIIENFAPAYVTAARQAKADAAAETEAALNAAEKEERAKQAAAQKTARESAAPARMQQVAGEVETVLKSFDIEHCERLLDAAAKALADTPQVGDLRELRADVKRLADLRERMVTGNKTSKYAVPQVTYRGQTYAVTELAPKGPVIQAGSGKMPLSWSDIAPEDLGETARRASDTNSGEEMLALGMLRYHLGQYPEARVALVAAQRLGAPVSRYMPKLEVKLKELEAKAKEAAAAEAKAKEAAAQAAAEKAATTPAATPATPAPVQDPEVTKALAVWGLEANRGLWKVGPDGVLQASQNPADQMPSLMSLKRALKKDFKTISIEVRGSGDAAGFSFGKNRRFVVLPDGSWQKLTVERNGVAFKVNGKGGDSLEPIGKEVTADNLAADGVVYVRFEGSKGEFRNLVVEE